MALGGGVLYGILAALCFALEPLFYERGGRDIPSPVANLVRLPLPLALLAAYVASSPFAREALDAAPSTVLLVLAGGVVNLAIADTLFIASIRSMGPSRAVSLSAVYPLIVMVLLREPLTPVVVAGIGLVVAGVSLVSTDRGAEGAPPGTPHPLHGLGPALPKGGLEAREGGAEHPLRGPALCLGAAACWAAGIAIFKLAVGSVRPEVLNLYRLAGAFAFLLAANAVGGGVRGALARVDRRSVAALSLGGFVGMVAGSLCLYRALALAPGGVVSAITAASPILTALVVLLRGDRVTGRLLGGVVATALGIALVAS